MKRLCLLCALCLALTACSAPVKTQEPLEAPEALETSGLTREEAKEALSQALLERKDSYLSYDPETGFDAGGIHYVWSDAFWPDEIREDTVENTKIYCFDLCYGPDADDGLEDVGSPMPGRLLMSYGIGKDGESIWEYRAGLGEWGPSWKIENGKDGTLCAKKM